MNLRRHVRTNGGGVVHIEVNMLRLSTDYKAREKEREREGERGKEGETEREGERGERER